MNQFYKASEARKKMPVVSRPDLVAERNAQLSTHEVKALFSSAPTDSRVYFRRPDLSCYAVLSPKRVAELRSKRKLDAFLERERDSGIIIPTDTHDDPHREAK